MQNFRETISSYDGRVLRIFDDLYKIHGDTLAKKLDARAIPLNFAKILADKNAYKRLQDFYHENRNVH